MSEPFWAVIPAGGRGVRAGLPVPKQFQKIGGVTVLERTVRRVLEVPGIEGVVVPLPASEAGESANDLVSEARRRLVGLSSAQAPVLVTEGGATRLESVNSGLQAVPRAARWIAVHDACRPFFSPELFARVVEAAQARGAAICAVAPSDTIKEVRRSMIASTLDRESLAAVQTPQVFAADLLREAYRAAISSGTAATDDSSLVERLGHPVAVVTGERRNIKITYPEDFSLGEILVAQETGRPGLEQPLARVPVTGIGFDVHPLSPGRRCVIGGVDIPFEMGLAGHSDADVLCHAVMDAVLGALGKGDIGAWFPDGDPNYEGASSIGLMASMWDVLKAEATVVNIDAVVIAEAPRVMPHAARIRENIAGALCTGSGRVSVKATTAEKLGTLGRGEGIAAFAIATILRSIAE